MFGSLGCTCLVSQGQEVRISWQREPHISLDLVASLHFFMLSTVSWVRVTCLAMNHSDLNIGCWNAQNLIDMDKEDQQSATTEDLHHRLHSAYFQFHDTDDVPLEGHSTTGRDEDRSGCSGESSRKESAVDELSHPTLDGLPVSRLRSAVRSLGSILRPKKRELPV